MLIENEFWDLLDWMPLARKSLEDARDIRLRFDLKLLAQREIVRAAAMEMGGCLDSELL